MLSQDFLRPAHQLTTLADRATTAHWRGSLTPRADRSNRNSFTVLKLQDIYTRNTKSVRFWLTVSALHITVCVMKLREARKAVGLSKMKLETLAGVSRNTVYNIEAGKNLNPSWGDVVAITNALRAAGMPGLQPEDIEFGQPRHEEVSR